MVCYTVGLNLLLFSSYFIQSNRAAIIPDHAQFLASVLLGDAEKVNTFLSRADINVNIRSLVCRNSCPLVSCVPF